MLPSRNQLSDKPWASPDEILYNALLWLDHHEAHVIYFSVGTCDPAHEKPDHWTRSYSLNGGDRGVGSLSAKQEFYSTLATACGKADAFILSGSSPVMAEFVKYLHGHEPETLDLICGIASLSRMTDTLLIAEARHCLAQA